MTTEYPLTPVGLEAQSRAAIKAWCDDPSVQLEAMDKEDTTPDKWILDTKDFFHVARYHYRIAAPKKWYLVAKLAGGMVVAVDNDMDELSIKTSSNFVEWLTKERVYYD